MATLQSGTSPGQRVKAGDLVLDRAKGAPITPIKKRVDGFAKVHRELVKAQAAAQKAVAAHVAQERKIGEADDAQDASVGELAGALVGAGAPRLKPFQGYSEHSPSDLAGMPQQKQARELVKIASKCAKHPDARVKKAASAARAAAEKLLAAEKPLAALARERSAAIAARDAIGPRWEKAFSALKRAAKSAEDDGATGLFAALFEVEGPARKKTTKKGE
ncbi:hypothetical protein [Sandaracinus amylolyticus]|uniref:hypothetical protein n=1 Tax=Sandaracinus amylolyticus TaxID=927083 RepID=UPI001F2E0108|nr:hypothetical protein [Sandaracinus amylolyticus]UJR82030.1 Hypothetical protein I5071_40950 [Sandaracinus amylolyticus]